MTRSVLSYVLPVLNIPQVSLNFYLLKMSVSPATEGTCYTFVLPQVLPSHAAASAALCCVCAASEFGALRLRPPGERC